MVGAVAAVGAVAPFDLFSDSGAWLSLLTKTLVGGVVFCGVQYAIWRLEGRPAGIEQRLFQVLSR
jgi:hypothetical protein